MENKAECPLSPQRIGRLVVNTISAEYICGFCNVDGLTVCIFFRTGKKFGYDGGVLLLAI